jgi:hypothetical protein
MEEEQKDKLRIARQAARARKTAVDADITEGVSAEHYDEPQTADSPNVKYGGAEASEIEALRAELAALKDKHKPVPGVEGDVQEALRDLIREQLQETFPERTPVRKTARDTVRPNAVVAIGRDGNPIYRKRSNAVDPFAIPEDLQDPAWDRAWIRISTHGQEDTSNQVSRLEQGWRFINADRPGWESRFMPPGYKGNIYKDGLALVERPMVLSEEARREAAQDVRNQSKAQREQFGLALPQGFSDRTDAARANTFARQGRPEAVPSNLQPTLDIDS